MEDEKYITISFDVPESVAKQAMKKIKNFPLSEQTTKPTPFAKKLFLKLAEGALTLIPSKIEVE
jgi:hypothetical protein